MRDLGRRLILVHLVLACLLLPAVLPIEAQTAIPLLREGDPLSGAPGETVTSLGSLAVNHVGGYSLIVDTSGSGTTLSHVWGSATGGIGTVIVSEGVYGDYQQDRFVTRHGLSDAGEPVYSAYSTSLITGNTDLSGVWLHTTPVLVEEEPVPTLPGQFSTHNSRPGVTSDGIPYWIGWITTTQGGSTENSVLFYSTALVPVLVGGDTIGGVPEPLGNTTGDIGSRYNFSPLGTHYLVPARVDTPVDIDLVLVHNGSALMAGGSIVREGSPIPASIGGLPGENWDFLKAVGITEDLQYLAAGYTDGDDATDEFVMVSGEIVLREGDLLETDEGMLPIGSEIQSGYMNADGDWAVVWEVEAASGTVEALILNGEMLLRQGYEMDLDGDGVEDPGAVLADFTGYASTGLAVGDRDDTGIVDVYFTADIDTMGTESSTDDIGVMYRLSVQAGEEPMLELPLDIKPGACPNPHNPRSKGRLPMSITGSMDFDVALIDIASLQLSRGDGVGGSVSPNEGPPGPRTMMKDETAPFFGDEDACECAVQYADGIYDLSIKFNSLELADVLELNGVLGDELVELVVTGALLDGTPFRASDCVHLVGGAVRPSH